MTGDPEFTFELARTPRGVGVRVGSRVKTLRDGRPAFPIRAKPIRASTPLSHVAWNEWSPAEVPAILEIEPETLSLFRSLSGRPSEFWTYIAADVLQSLEVEAALRRLGESLLLAAVLVERTPSGSFSQILPPLQAVALAATMLEVSLPYRGSDKIQCLRTQLGKLLDLQRPA